MQASAEHRTSLQTITVSAPIAASNPGSVWIMRMGYADVFLARLRPDGSLGAREHIGRVDAGMAAFGIATATLSPVFTIVLQPGPGAQLLVVDRTALMQIEHQALGCASPELLLEMWITGLAHAVSGDLEPKQYQSLKAGATYEIPNQPLPMAPLGGVVWVRHLQGEAKLLGRPDLTPIAGNQLFPLANPAWIEEAPHNRLAVYSTRQAIDGSFWTSGLDFYHEVVFRAVVAAQELADERQRARFAARDKGDQVRLESSIRQLIAPLAPEVINESKPSEDRHPLLRACEAIGKEEHITFRPSPEMIKQLPMRDPVASVARASMVRYRKVVLGLKWHRNEGYALLGFREKDERPLALIPRGNRYEIFDPVEGTRTKVTDEIATGLQPFAYMFYRPLPAKSITVKELMLFALAGSWRDMLFILAVGLCGGLLGTVTPLITGAIFDTIIPGAQKDRMLQAGLFVFAASLAATLLELSRGFTLMRVENKVESKVQAAVWDRLLALPAPFFREYAAGDLSSRAMTISSIRKMLTGSVMSAIFSGIFSVFNFFLLFKYSVPLALLATALTLIQILALLLSFYISWRKQTSALAVQGRVFGLVLELIQGIPKFRVAGTEHRAFSIWSRMFGALRQRSIGMRAISNYMMVFNSAFHVLCYVAIYYMTSKLLMSGESQFTTGSFVAFGAAYAQFSGSLVSMVQTLTGLVTVGPMYKRAAPILLSLPESDPSKPLAGELTGRIELNHIFFRYRKDGPLILNDISLGIEPGQFVAFVGPSGSGKSTLFRMMLGFERPASGTVFFDGQDMATLDLPSIRSQIGVVLQNGTLFNGDIFQNIVCSAPYTLDDAWEAARMAGFDKDLQNMPMGLHTVVGDGGAGLSGGQRQRLMIARAVVGKPRILLMDEATSALDNHTQAVVSRSLETLRSTRVVIAHRLTTVMKADKIFVIDKGNLVQSGTFEELLSQPGPFAELAKRQLT